MKSIKKHKSPNSTNELIKVKHRWKIYTPDYLVNIILDQGHYVFGNINKKHTIDNSCWDWQFLIHIVDRYCKDFLNSSNNLEKLKTELEEYIHWIEIDPDELSIAIDRCSKVAQTYWIKNVCWNFIQWNTLKTTKYDWKMDFVLWNPPYVRVHNLKDSFDDVKKSVFWNWWMTDLYIAFYEKWLSMLNNNWTLCYITPSSFFTSIAWKTMREYLLTNSLLESICDLKHFQPFNAITYTTIVCLNKQKSDNKVNYYEFDSKNLKPIFVESLDLPDYYINWNYYFSKKWNLSFLKRILTNTIKSDVAIKNWYATLADKVFIGDFQFDSEYIIPVLKWSRWKWTKIFYPYDKSWKLIKEEVLKEDQQIYNYINSKKEELLNRSLEGDKKNWYAFGRSQGIKDTNKNKISINTLLKWLKDLKIIDVSAWRWVYSWLYITSDTIALDKIKDILYTEEFITYISLLWKYKNWWCYTYSSKDLKSFLDYKLL